MPISSLCWAPLSNRTWIEISGKDSGGHLHRFCTQDIQSIEEGQGKEALFLDAKGRVVGWGEVFRTASDPVRWIIVAGGSQAAKLIPHLDRYVIREDVKFEDRSSSLGFWLVRGKDLSQLAELGFTGSELPAASRMTSVELASSHDGTNKPQAFLVGSSEFGSGYAILAATESLRGEVERVLSLEADSRRDEQWVEAARIQQGFPRFELDTDDKTLPQELHRDATAIHFQKGCYLGQETVARIDAMGHVNRLLVRVSGNGAVPVVPCPLVHGDAEVGRLTSVARVSSDCGREPGADWVGLATIKRSVLKTTETLRCGQYDSLVSLHRDASV